MNALYAMRRANGDWFALEHGGRLRVPVYRDRQQALAGQSRHAGMLLFRPVVINEPLLADLDRIDHEASVCFWLVEDSLHNPTQGRMMEMAEFRHFLADTRPVPSRAQR